MRGEVLRRKSAEGTFVRRGVLRMSAEKGGRGLKRGSAEGECEGGVLRGRVLRRRVLKGEC